MHEIALEFGDSRPLHPRPIQASRVEVWLNCPSVLIAMSERTEDGTSEKGRQEEGTCEEGRDEEGREEGSREEGVRE